MDTPQRPFAILPSVLVGCVAVLVALVGEWSPAFQEALDSGYAHHSVHLFHALLPLAACVVFAILVARDIRQHGWPTFSWRRT
jgi:hypothetical protein